MSSAPRRLAVIGSIAFAALFALVAYTFLHEAGHAIVGMLFGARLTSFSINFVDLSAHVGFAGAFSSAQQSVLSAAGVTFPLLLWSVFVLAVPVKPNPLLGWLRLVLSMGVLNSLLAWIIIPVLYLSGRSPADDSATFVSATKIPPLLLSAAVLIVYVGGWALFLRRSGYVQGLRDTISSASGDFTSAAARRTLLVMSAILAAIAMTAALSGAFVGFRCFVHSPGRLHSRWAGRSVTTRLRARVSLRGQRGKAIDSTALRCAARRQGRAVCAGSTGAGRLRARHLERRAGLRGGVGDRRHWPAGARGRRLPRGSDRSPEGGGGAGLLLERPVGVAQRQRSCATIGRRFCVVVSKNLLTTFALSGTIAPLENGTVRSQQKR